MIIYPYNGHPLLRRAVHIVTGIAVSVCLAWFTVNSFFGQVIVSGHSMIPALNEGDTCLYNGLCYDFSSPARFDVIAFRTADEDKIHIKRVLGLPGENVRISGGSLIIDGNVITDERVPYISIPGLAENSIELGEDEFFVVGDNADASEDSRFLRIGNIMRKDILGKLWLRIRPLSGLGFIK